MSRSDAAAGPDAASSPDGDWAEIVARLDTVPDGQLQAMLAAAVRAYAARAEMREIAPFPEGSAVTATDVVITATEFLKAVQLQPFELGMWQAWSDRS